MKAILINPFDETITEVDFIGDYRSIYKLIDCSTFDVMELPRNGALYVDDEGLFTERQAFFYWEGAHQPIANKALILGTDEYGSNLPSPFTVEEVKAAVTFGHPFELEFLAQQARTA